ncbi:MAG TPA: FixH family protein [Thermomicrobiales bacterium]|nr:FixH family protein [Thermomicrobiales bacterium]
MSATAACRPASATARRAPAGGFILLLIIVLTGCGGRDDASGSGNVTARIMLHPAPAVVGPARVEMRLTDRSNAPVTGATVQVEGTMSHAGMAPVIRDAVETADGQYTVDDFAFTMAGDWVLIVSGTTGAGAPIKARVDIGAVGIDAESLDAPLIPSERCYSTPTPEAGD